jgi:DNA helicase TIP49 (TBP-interacting protein)
MGMSKHDAYYEPEDYDDRSDEIEHRTYELMKVGAKYDYRTASAIAEALSELDVAGADSLQVMIDTGDYEKIGRKVMMMALDYMERFAKDAAESEIND